MEALSAQTQQRVDISTFIHKIETVITDLESDGKVEKRYKNEGDIIRRGDVICDIELEVSPPMWY